MAKGQAVGTLRPDRVPAKRKREPEEVPIAVEVRGIPFEVTSDEISAVISAGGLNTKLVKIKVANPGGVFSAGRTATVNLESQADVLTVIEELNKFEFMPGYLLEVEQKTQQEESEEEEEGKEEEGQVVKEEEEEPAGGGGAFAWREPVKEAIVPGLKRPPLPIRGGPRSRGPPVGKLKHDRNTAPLPSITNFPSNYPDASQGNFVQPSGPPPSSWNGPAPRPSIAPHLRFSSAEQAAEQWEEPRGPSFNATRDDQSLGQYSGIIKSFNSRNGYGFISCQALRDEGYENDVYLHHSQKGEFEPGDEIVFTAQLNKKGQPQATELQAVS